MNLILTNHQATRESPQPLLLRWTSLSQGGVDLFVSLLVKQFATYLKIPPAPFDQGGAKPFGSNTLPIRLQFDPYSTPTRKLIRYRKEFTRGLPGVVPMKGFTPLMGIFS